MDRRDAQLFVRRDAQLFVRRDAQLFVFIKLTMSNVLGVCFPAEFYENSTRIPLEFH